MPRAYNEEQVIEAYEQFKPWAVHVDNSFATPNLSNYLHEIGVHVWINALGDVDNELKKNNTLLFEQLVKNKSNIIQTDIPLIIQEQIDKQLVAY
jgi:glycerophosphoryl diester phosphodiesterase